MTRSPRPTWSSPMLDRMRAMTVSFVLLGLLLTIGQGLGLDLAAPVDAHPVGGVYDFAGTAEDETAMLASAPPALPGGMVVGCPPASQAAPLGGHPVPTGVGAGPTATDWQETVHNPCEYDGTADSGPIDMTASPGVHGDLGFRGAWAAREGPRWPYDSNGPARVLSRLGGCRLTPRAGPGTAIEVHPFSGGATHITTTRNLQRFPGSPTVGGPDGLFVAPTRQIDDLLASGASRSQIEVALGLNKGSLRGGDLVRVDITDPFARGLRLPDPKLGNIHHRPGTGLITGNIYEAVVDSPLKNQPRVLLSILTGRS